MIDHGIRVDHAKGNPLRGMWQYMFCRRLRFGIKDGASYLHGTGGASSDIDHISLGLPIFLLC